jgi:hypothetical protein
MIQLCLIPENGSPEYNFDLIFLLLKGQPFLI